MQAPTSSPRVDTLSSLRKAQKFVSPPSDSLICPIHLGLFVEPAIARCGHTFCRECIIESLAHMEQCPVDAQPLDADMLVPNLAVKGQINDLIVHCPHGLRIPPESEDGSGRGVFGGDDNWEVDPDGCQVTCRLGDLPSHEKECPFAWVVCPNSEACGLLRKSELEAHVAACGRISCPNAKIGCDFVATAAGVAEHVPVCKFETMKDVMSATNQQFTELKELLERKDKEISLLTQTVVDLSNKLENLAGNLEHTLGIYDQSICKIHIAIEDTRRQVGHSLDEITMVKQRIGSDADSHLYPHMFKCKGTVSGHTGPVWTLVATDTLLFSGSSDETIRVWSIETFQCLHVMEGHTGIIHALVLYQGEGENQVLVSGSSDCSIRIWDTQTFECLRVLDARDNAVCTLAVHNNLLLAGSLKTVAVWSLESLEMVRELKEHNHWVRAMTIEGDLLYCGSYNCIVVWSLESFSRVATIQCNSGSVYSLLVTGNYLVAGTYDSVVAIFDRNSHEILHTLQGHIGTVYSVITIPGFLATASYDCTVKLWNLSTFTCVQTLVRHTSSVDTLIYVHNKLFSGSADNSLKVWA